MLILSKVAKVAGLEQAEEGEWEKVWLERKRMHPLGGFEHMGMTFLML